MSIIWRFLCKWFGHRYEEVHDGDVYLGKKCFRCGHHHMDRRALLQALMPGLNDLFGIEYKPIDGKQGDTQWLNRAG